MAEGNFLECVRKEWMKKPFAFFRLCENIFNMGFWIGAGTNFVLNLVLIPHFQAAGTAMVQFKRPSQCY